MNVQHPTFNIQRPIQGLGPILNDIRSLLIVECRGVFACMLIFHILRIPNAVSLGEGEGMGAVGLPSS
jgi:hypothetical protein